MLLYCHSLVTILKRFDSKGSHSYKVKEMDSEEFQQKELGKKLNRDKVKLWLPPYTTASGGKGDYSQELVSKYTAEMKLTQETVLRLLENLRQHALQKLAEREKFQKSGLATLKLKVSGNVKTTRTATQEHGSKQVIDIEISLDDLGSILKQTIAGRIGSKADHLKLIFSGRVIQDTVTLREQNVKNGCQIMVLCLTLTESDTVEQDKHSAQVRDTRHAAELLSDRASTDLDDGVNIQIADQTGKPLQLPAAERRALTLAMTLHEKGRSALKQRNITLALPLLLEADKEFRSCSADILDYVDNYAVLCLDIVWCYLCLKNIEDLPDADERLRTSESFFRKCYGSDMQRLVAVKGGSGKELALFMRLHLLQGIVAFHQSRLTEAERLLAQAEAELQRLGVEEEKLTEVMKMGFKEREARLGLRASGGNLEGAITHIMKRKEEQAEIAKKVKEERKKKQLAKKFGKTASGELVNIDNYKILLGMGYPKGAVVEALRQANNNVNWALEIIQKHPEYLSLPDPETKNSPVNISDAMIAQLTVLGFEPEMIRRALVKNHGDIEKAAGDLLQNNGIMAPVPESVTPSDSSSGSSSGSVSLSEPSTSSGSSSSSPIKTPEELQHEKEAIDLLVSDLPEDEEDYLDLELKEEAEFLQQYKTLLVSLFSQHT